MLGLTNSDEQSKDNNFYQTNMAEGVFIGKQHGDGALISSALHPYNPCKKKNAYSTKTTQQNILVTKNVNNVNNESKNESEQSIKLSESTARCAEFNVKRVKKIKRELGRKGFFITDEAAIYLCKKTASDSKEELKGFIEAISDELLSRKEITLDYDLAKEAVLTRKMFARIGQGTSLDLGPVMQDLKEQYKKDVNELKELLAQNKQSSIKPYIYATLLSGATTAALGLALYKTNIDNATLMQAQDNIIEGLKELNRELIKTGGKAMLESTSSIWENIAGRAADTLITIAAIKAIEGSCTIL